MKLLDNIKCKYNLDLIGASPVFEILEYNYFQDWISKDYNGDMEYLKKNMELRKNPRLLADWIKSVVVIGFNYKQPNFENSIINKIASFARIDDYHKIIGKKLHLIAKDILDITKSKKYKISVDTSPVLEKIWAQKSGLGWIGKNTLIINPKYGSFLFLGLIFLEIDLSMSENVVSKCGNCNLCIKSCPTGALVSPYVLDARKCLSYISIEYKGIVMEKYKNLFSNLLFGCEKCQIVCPWNKNTPISQDKFFTVRKEYESIDLEKILFLTEEEFKKIFSNSTIKRAKIIGIKRNAILMIGAKKDKNYLNPLLKLKNIEKNEIIQDSINWALKKIATI